MAQKVFFFDSIVSFEALIIEWLAEDKSAMRGEYRKISLITEIHI